ncbi:MAG: alpha/beta hydrolase [Myxococcota bacterium]
METTIETVRFDAHGETLVGHLHRPAHPDGPLPAVTLLGPMTFVKEQAPTEYATRLARRGFAALAFDPRYHGESGGHPRRLESPMSKVQDVIASVDYLTSRPEVDGRRIFGLGICQGSSELIRALADDERMGAGATIAGHYRDQDGDDEWLTSGGRAARLARGWKAKLHFEETGEVTYVPAVHEERMDVGMPGKFVWDWYHHWADQGVWDDRYAVMSDAELLTYESLSAAARLRKPYLMIHSDQCFLPAVAKRHYDAIPSDDKHLSWKGDTPHLAFYDQAPVIDPTADEIARFFASRHR